MAGLLLPRAGRLLRPRQGLDAPGAALTGDERVAGVGFGAALTAEGRDAREIELPAGWIAAPGFVDLHAHLREPGYEGKETIATGARAAARGGFTTICCMPNTN